MDHTSPTKKERRTEPLAEPRPRGASEQHRPTLPFGSAVQVLLLMQEPRRTQVGRFLRSSNLTLARLRIVSPASSPGSLASCSLQQVSRSSLAADTLGTRRQSPWYADFRGNSTVPRTKLQVVLRVAADADAEAEFRPKTEHPYQPRRATNRPFHPISRKASQVQGRLSAVVAAWSRQSSLHGCRRSPLLARTIACRTKFGPVFMASDLRRQPDSLIPAEYLAS